MCRIKNIYLILKAKKKQITFKAEEGAALNS